MVTIPLCVTHIKCIAKDLLFHSNTFLNTSPIFHGEPKHASNATGLFTLALVLPCQLVPEANESYRFLFPISFQQSLESSYIEMSFYIWGLECLSGATIFQEEKSFVGRLTCTRHSRSLDVKRLGFKFLLSSCMC